MAEKIWIINESVGYFNKAGIRTKATRLLRRCAPRNDGSKNHTVQRNLIGNAVKFTYQGSITIETELLDIMNNKALIRFKVSDTGIGIPLEQQDKVFDRFFRASPSYKEQYSGHGVGLHIAQSYARLLGGEIKLNSQENIGTTFYFDLLCEIGAIHSTLALKMEPHESLANTESSYSLLLVEDNPIALKVLESIVSTAGMRFKSAIDGESALELAKSCSFNLIISDIGLPGISGNDFSLEFRAWEKLQNNTPIPIIGLTAHAQDSIKDKCLESGMNDVFSKPMTKEILQTIISQYLSNMKSIITNSEEKKHTEETLGPDLPNTEDELFELSGFPLLDIEKALTFMGNNQDTLKELLTIVINQEIPNEKALIEAAYARKDWDSIEKLAHKMKGGAVYYGVIRMQFACQYLERYRKAGHSKLLERLYKQMIRTLDETLYVVTQWLANH